MLSRKVVEEARELYVARETSLYTCPVIEDAYAAVHGVWCDDLRALAAGADWALFWTGGRNRNGYWLDVIDDETDNDGRRAFRLEMFDAYLSNDEERIDALRRRIRGIDT